MRKGLSILRRWWTRRSDSLRDDLTALFRLKYNSFKDLLASNSENLDIIADMEEALRGARIFGMSYVRSQSARAVFHALRMVKDLDALSGRRYPLLFRVLEEINGRIKAELETRKHTPIDDLVLPYHRIHKEMADWVGGKNANLGEVRNRAGLPTPDGFAVTTRAFELFLDENDLVDEINKRKMGLDANDPGGVAGASEEIQRLFLSARIPKALEDAIIQGFDDLEEAARRAGALEGPLRVSMRSSALGEDGELSFAGQYVSLLNVPREKILQTYRFIAASLYTPRAISYRLNHGIRDEDVAMSVACLRMVDSVASGIIYSRHPFQIQDDSVTVTAVWGLGLYAVGGVLTPDTFTVGRGRDLPIVRSAVSRKPVKVVSNPEGGLLEVPVPEADQERPALTPEQVRTLALYAIRLEEHYQAAQDMEWALDRRGQLYVLQARPLRLRPTGLDARLEEAPVPVGHEVLVGSGDVACPGVGCGPAHHVRSEEDLVGFPDGAVLVARHSSPKFVVVMRRARAIVAESGSVTGHMASLAREFGVPALLDARGALANIPPGGEVTVDAYAGRVYAGRVEALLAVREPRKTAMIGTPVHETLQRVARWIVPLNLTDPKSPDFNPQGCKTLHDIMRFVHEVSYREMFQISDAVTEGGVGAMKLDIPLPIDLHIIDLGEGVQGVEEGSRKVTVSQIASLPFRALLKGMMHDELRAREPRPVELKGFLSVMSEQMLTNPHVSERFGDRSFAIISDKYVNFSSRVGYHYSVLDSYCGQTVNKNYITFAFKGGAADEVRRNRRAQAIALILGELGMEVEVKGDRVSARFQKYDRPTVEEKLELLGRLLIFTRQLDMLMKDEASVHTMARCFLTGDYSCDLG
jgi:pyruvate,water dikinase